MKFLLLIALCCLLVAGIAEAAIVFGGDGGTTSSQCTLNGYLETACNTCVDSGASDATIDAAEARCAVQRSGACEAFPEFSDYQVENAWLICVSASRGATPADHEYNPRWVAKSDTWRLFPPHVSNDWNVFAGNEGTNCTCNEPYVVNPADQVQDVPQDIIGAATSYDDDTVCGSGNVIVHVGYRNLNNNWHIIRPTADKKNNYLIRTPRNGANTDFSNPGAWEPYRQDESLQPGLPPESFAPGPGAYYYGWMAYLEDADAYYYGWLIDGVIVCLDHLTGCNGMVSIPPASPEIRTKGWGSSVEYSESSQATLQYRWRKFCSAASDPNIAVFPTDVPSGCASGVASISASCANDLGTQGSNDFICTSFTTQLAPDQAIAFAVEDKGTCKKFPWTHGSSITVNPASGFPGMTPGFVGLQTNAGQCLGWRGPIIKCNSCSSAGLSCTGHSDCGNGGVNCWVEPDSCQCQPCPAETAPVCFGSTRWSEQDCACRFCEPPASCVGTAENPYNCDFEAGTCTYNPVDPCSSQCATCDITEGCDEGWQDGAAGYPPQCNPCRSCLDNTASKNACEMQGDKQVGFWVQTNAAANTCECYKCGLRSEWEASGGLYTNPMPANVFEPACRSGSLAVQMAKPDVPEGQVGDQYYDPSVSPCFCQECSDLWSDPTYFPIERFSPDGECAASDSTVPNGDACAQCVECGGCPPGYEIELVASKKGARTIFSSF